jgi:predicted unusual protein kinase regulating ubiquinone biosynthesis (AarF/ABC1/UbiB family)
MPKELSSFERRVPTSRLGRLFRTGANVGAMASAVLSREDVDLDGVMKFVRGLGELKGVGMKAGQLLSYIDPTLPAELRDALALLQTTSAASPWASVEATIRTALGERADQLLHNLDRAPIAVASIGQVHRARIDGVDVAVKVRHEGIVEALRSDFAAAGVGSAFTRMFVPGAANSVKSMVAEAREAMLEECDFGLEAARQRRFATRFAQHDVLRIPDVRDAWCGDAVLTTRFMGGASLDAALERPQHVRDRFGAALFELYLGTLYRHGEFHADPHPGNYAFTTDDRVVVYDFGCVRTFDDATVDGLRALLCAVRSDDRRALRSALEQLGATPTDDERIRALLRGFFAPLLVKGPHRIEPGDAIEARAMFRDKRTLMKLALPGKLLFLLRIRFGLYSVLARLGSVADWAALEASFAESRPPAYLNPELR